MSQPQVSQPQMSQPQESTNAVPVVVVGAGLGGLATAMRLAAQGYQVTVYEKQSGPGGKAFTETIGAYRFDTGPSLLTMRHVFERLFADTGASLSDYLTTTPLDPICRYFWRDGVRVSTFADRERMAQEFARAFNEPPEHLYRFLDYAEKMHRISGHLFLEKSLHEWSTLSTKGFFSSLMQLHRIDLGRTMAQANESFFSHPRLQQLFNRYATYNGSDPWQTPATLNIIPHVEYGLGGWAVQGGIHQIPQALERRARELGVTFHYNTPVSRILVENRQVQGVEVAGERIAAPVVVSNADVTPTYRSLLEDTAAPVYKRYQQLEPSSSGVVFYWGVGRRFPELGLHNIFFSDDYRQEFREIFTEQRLPQDPTIYINITSKEGSPEDAPAHGENWFVLINAPWDNGQDWRSDVARLRATVLQRLSHELHCDVEELIEVESQMLPGDIQQRTDSWRGSLYGISSNSAVAAFRRHPNRSRRHKGLYFVGGSAHPGGGMPLVVLGGEITAGLIARYHKPR